ncbi:serine/threonine-protein kinase [Actinophytocola algeriensis]|uniref:non-specific serine/threonine protein kinase n=1 Tax=Actinophytocola algeriensis TaxID=1768010 RepID=A0A7W7PZJ0_9PSEU|nr:serine/threonine-protein kinase [Actinophytocola algeriensis]MBB4904088.1 serine/threonine protein kinase [Actinophytocola algeriensis]MBE1477055.1 serine/threonine protein kinase [Actinophytocola algeriensis]
MVIEKGALVAGRYRLIEQVGSGAMGVVWKAQDERLGRTVAIKRLVVRYALSESMTEETRRRAMREARIAARLQHRNAIALFDVAEHEGDPILVMEFLPSKSLSLVLEERGTLTPAEAAEIGAQVAEAIAAAHAVGIAHRDIKPGNILLAENGTVKITDFGISRALDDGTVTTQTGMLAGTPAYLAPEIARGDESSRASDVFSLGSTLYHAVEGRPPFGTNTNPLALLHAVASGNVPPPRNAGPLAPTLMSLMRVDPTERPSMQEAAAALASTTTEPLPVPATRQAPKTPPRPVIAANPTPPRPIVPAQPTAAFTRPPSAAPQAGPSRKNLVIVGAVALVVLAGTLFTVLMLTNKDEPGGTRQAGGGTSQTGGGTSRSQTQTEDPDETTEPSDDASNASDPGPLPPDPAGPIDYSQAGQLVINYFGDVQNAAARWAMLTAHGQAQFGGQDAFNQYWSQFTAVSSANANGVTPNADGSVTVPVDVTYTTAGGPKTEHRTIRVTRVAGTLLIDSAAK